MKNERKLAYQQRRIETLQSQVNSLEEENKVLARENESLRVINDELRQSVENLQKKHDSVLQVYTEGLAEIQDIKQKFTEALESSSKLQKVYGDKMRLLMKRLKRQKE